MYFLLTRNKFSFIKNHKKEIKAPEFFTHVYRNNVAKIFTNLIKNYAFCCCYYSNK